MRPLSTTETDQTLEEIYVDIAPDKHHVIRQAAGILDLRVGEFLVASAVANADRVLADHRWQMLAQDAEQRFQALLDATGRFG